MIYRCIVAISSYTSNVFMRSCCRQFSTSLLIMNQLSPFWKRVVTMKHRSTMYNRLTMNFLNHFKCFCGIKTAFPTKTNPCMLFNCFFHYDLWYGQNRQVTSHHDNVPHCELFRVETWHAWRRGFIGELPQVSWRLPY